MRYWYVSLCIWMDSLDIEPNFCFIRDRSSFLAALSVIDDPIFALISFLFPVYDFAVNSVPH